MKVVRIDESRCDGCGLCVKACHEGALALRNGKAVMVDHMLCDGIGDCLPACPQNAIYFFERPDDITAPQMTQIGGPQWPIKLELVAERNPVFDGKDLLIAADCSAFTYPDVMRDFCKDGIRIIACPKLGKVDQEKLENIISKNEIRSITVLRMEVPCCGPLAMKTQEALEKSGKNIPLSIKTISRGGAIKGE